VETAIGSEGVFERGSEDSFTGEVWVRNTLTAPDGTNVGIVHFAPRARTHWHRHPGGQFLFGLSGRGRARTRGQAGHVLQPGDVVRVGPDEWHYHGGDAEAPMIHVALNLGGSAEWGDPVTDDEYAEGV
jgi:quercetin dioxygenase-like cupin family protein